MTLIYMYLVTSYSYYPTLSLNFILLTGEMLVLFIQLQGNFEGTRFTEAILLTIDGDTIQRLNLTDIGDGEYTTPFVTPSQPFQIQIIGSSDNSGNPISRISTTGVEPTDEEIGMKQLG